MTRLADKVPVEPLSRDRLDRIEDGVAATFASAAVAQPAARRRIGWLVAPALTAAVAGVGFYVLLRPTQTMESVAAPTRVVTPLGEGATLSIGDATVELAGGSAAEIRHDADGAIDVRLYVGRVDCEVTPRADRPPFVVTAGEVEVRVVGTIFAVERDDEVRVFVSRGKVSVSAAGSAAAVAAGESWSQPVAAREPLPRWAMAVGDSPRLAAAAKRQGGSAPEPEPPASVDEADAVVAAVEPAVEPAPPAAKAPARKTEPKRRKKPEREVEPEPAPPTTLPKPYAGTPPTARFHELRDLETSDLADAIKQYGRSLSGADAEYALYRLAYVEYVKRRRTSAGVRYARAVEKRFPKGKFAEHAHWLRIHALHKAGKKADCRAAAQSYLRRYPKAAHREQARHLIDWY